MMKKPMQIAPGTIRKVRERLNETQGQFATRLGVDQATVSRWECGALPKTGAMQMLLQKVLHEIDRVHPIRG